MGRWVDGMAYDDGGVRMKGEYEGASVITPSLGEKLAEEKRFERIEYLEEFWLIQTNDMKISELRQINEDIIRQTGYEIPEEYSI
jgi:hypothetical protein